MWMNGSEGKVAEIKNGLRYNVYVQFNINGLLCDEMALTAGYNITINRNNLITITMKSP